MSIANLPELIEEFESNCRTSEGVAAAAWGVAVAILALADAQERTATWLKWLGNGDAATPMGAIEALGAVLKEELGSIASSISESGLG